MKLVLTYFSLFRNNALVCRGTDCMVANHVQIRLEQAVVSHAQCRVDIIADDLTGACDAAVAFAPVMREVRVALEEPAGQTADVWAFSTETRDVEPNCCAAVLHGVLTQRSGGTEVFKKIDSVFRGNTVLEIAETVTCFPKRLAIVAPAFPALGRTVEGGTLFIEDGMQSQTVPIDRLLTGLGCSFVSVPASLDAGSLLACIEMERQPEGSALLCDATDQAHLEALVIAARAAKVPIVWVGSGGLAHALATQYPALPASAVEVGRTGQPLFFIGSDHPATRGQVLHLQQITGIPTSSCGEPAQVCEHGLLLSVPRGEVEARVREAVSAINPDDVGCLFMTGGDTARLVCRALGIRSLRLMREFAPGVPLGAAEGGRFNGVPVLLKSGGFGPRDLLRQVLDVFSRKEVVTSCI